MQEDYSPTGRAVAKSVLRMLRPHDLIGAGKIRVGRLYDGGYVMVDRLAEAEICYSLGINDDVSWDMEMALQGKHIYQYDPTISALPQEHELFHWRAEWIGGVVNEGEHRQTLAQAVKQNGHTDHRNMILKCDIEWAEWPLLQNTPNSVLRQFSQMVFEIHGMQMLADPMHAENIRAAFSNLTASHHVVHVHGNNFSSWTIVGGVPVPETLELTLVRKDEGEFKPSQTRFPTPLDMPCDRTRADLELGQFDFS